METDIPRVLPRWLALLALSAALQFSNAPALLAEVAIPGLAASQLEPEVKGLVLIEELNCVACHAGDASLKARSKRAPRLSEVGSRVNPDYVEAFIGDPHGTKPGTTMPEALTSLGAAEKKQAATELKKFLLPRMAAEHGSHPQPCGERDGVALAFNLVLCVLTSHLTHHANRSPQ